MESSNNHKSIKFIRIFLLALIIIGIGLLLTRSSWVPQLVDKIIEIEQGTSQDPGTPGECFVGGCSSQICSDNPDAVSTCEYREEYGCYKNATCERQATGECGWTQTSELNACLGISL